MYSLIFTETAKQDYINIARYIAEESSNTDIVIKYILKLQSETERLKEFPDIGIFPKDRFILSVGYRILICDDYLTFYKILEEEKKVVIHKVINGKRDYKHFLRNK